MPARQRLNHILSHLNVNSVKAIEAKEYVFITGCSRGIGYGLVRHFLTDGRYFVIASCRSPHKANQLKSLLSQYPTRSILIELDTSLEQSIMNAAKSIRKQNLRVDILINNAAIVSTKVPSYKETVINFDTAEMANILNVNLIGPATIFKYFFNQSIFGSNARVINITSNVASLTKDTHGQYLSYRISKTGVNMLTVLQQMQIGNRYGIKTVCIDPGHVQTRMGMEQSGFDTAPLTVDESCSAIIDIIQEMRYNDKYNGKFVKYNGDMMQF